MICLKSHLFVMFKLCLLLINLFGESKGDPNFVLILTDDQDLILDGMVPMEKTLELVANEGKTFQNAFVNTPVCCPSRSTILTGKFNHNTGVTNNSLEGNCSSTSWQENQEPFSISAILQEKGNYLTFYAGKYLNGYGNVKAGGMEHIPKGYDWWIGLQGNSKYYNYSLSVNGTTLHLDDQYLTDLLADYSIKFLNEKPPNRPFFMTVAPPAPHAPFTPADRHKNSFPNTKALRNPSFNFSASNKHWLVGMPPDFLPENVTVLDNVQRHRHETLLAVDELVEKIVLTLKETGNYDETYIIFTSDNGFHIGQFTQPWDKRQPYETDIRIPFVISGPLVPSNSLESNPISMVDLAPTILDLAEIEIPLDMDGISFKKHIFSEENETFEKNIFIEYWGEGNTVRVEDTCPWKGDQDVTECWQEQWCKCQDSRNNTYVCVLEMSNTQQFKLCEFDAQQGFLEAYDLVADPHELENIASKLDKNTLDKYHSLIANFKGCQGINCHL